MVSEDGDQIFTGGIFKQQQARKLGLKLVAFFKLYLGLANLNTSHLTWELRLQTLQIYPSQCNPHTRMHKFKTKHHKLDLQ